MLYHVVRYWNECVKGATATVTAKLYKYYILCVTLKLRKRDSWTFSNRQNTAKG